MDAERAAKAEEAKARAVEQAEARKAAAASERAARDANKAAAPSSSSSKASSAPKGNKYGTVERISTRQERIDARIASGEEAPSLFGIK